ncbi:MAG: peptide-methionine (S)-S-oxide reductase MsrA [Gammaproteobacteria bacterium]|nr:peptide-methionine (S)-S-oxide reductase MsrA [Gammaproteobacteria bacterium]
MSIDSVTLGGGCFWCLEAAMNQLKGVKSVISGYADGEIADPSYEQICTGTTGHAEVIQITFDSDIISLHTLLDVFFTIHDPTTLNRQGADRGSQYRSTILYHNDSQSSEAEQYIAQLNDSGKWSDPIVTELKPLDIFYEAEQYHQNYFQLNPQSGYCRAVIPPKLEKLEHEYPSFLK